MGEDGRKGITEDIEDGGDMAEKSKQNTLKIEREIIVNNVKVKIKSIFIGEQTLNDKLFVIADRKLKMAE